VRQLCPRIDTIVDDTTAKANELAFEPTVPKDLSEDEMVALAAYSHDLNLARREGNLYFELNGSLRERSQHGREALVRTWGGFMRHMMRAMRRLPKIKCTCYRGYPDKQMALLHYVMGKPIQWGAFTSTSIVFDVTKQFTDRVNGVIFKINVTDGRDITAFSFFPQEGEVLLSPAHRFTVCSDPYERDGYTLIDLVQQEGNMFVS
jgi:hypothetical protein